MNVTTVGLDLAKSVFQVHGVDVRGKPVLKKQLRRDQVAAYFANLPACLIGIEACGSAHHWARKLESLGHAVKLMAPQFVKPYVKTNKNDAADAEAICEAVGRPNMRFVPMKNVEQQAVLAMHRVRQGFVKARTAQANQIRGLLAEFGVIIPKGIAHVAGRVPELIEDGANELPGSFRRLIQRLLDHLKDLDRQVDELEEQIRTWHRSSELSCKLEKIPGIGPITASALVATVGDAKSFESARQMSAWMGLVPRQSSSGGKTTLLGISKRGDTYLRTLLIHGARSVVRTAERRRGPDDWLIKLQQRRTHNASESRKLTLPTLSGGSSSLTRRRKADLRTRGFSTAAQTAACSSNDAPLHRRAELPRLLRRPVRRLRRPAEAALTRASTNDASS